METSGQVLRQGERRYVTVLFADMKGFTDLSRRLDPEEMDLLMERVFLRFESIISAYGGGVEKYIGDALVAVFGVPQIHEDDPTRAVYAALDFLDQLKNVKLDDSGDLAPVGFRIGINTGLITTGKRGQQEVVTGHAMAVAARLESEAELNTVFVSEATREKCSDDFLFSKRQLLKVTEGAEPVAAYKVLGRIETPPVSDLPFLGREELVSELTRSYLSRSSAEPLGVTLTGPPGVGKTRIATAFIEGLRRFPEFHTPVLYARVRRFRRATFSVIRDLIQSGLSLNRNSEAERITRAVSALPEISREEAQQFARLFAGGEEENGESSPFLLLYKVLEALCRGAKRQYPPILFVENLHHIDPQSRDFLAFFFENTETRPFVLATSRSEEMLQLPVFRETAHIAVPPLDRERSRELLRALLTQSSRSLPEERVEELLELAAGNPLFILEYARYAEASGPEVPTTVQSIFLSVVDSYNDEQKAFLKKMSVFAHSYNFDEARYLLRRTGGDPEKLSELTEFFVEQEVLHEEGGAYFFRNDAFKMAVYSSILNHNKRILHRAIADYMREQNAPEFLRLMHHLSRAEAWEELETLILETPGTIMYLETIRYVELLLNQLSRKREEVASPRIANLLFYKAAIYFNNGKTNEADEVLKRILAAAVEERNYEYSARAYHILTAYNVKLCSFQNAELCGRKALAYYERVGDSGEARRDVLRSMAVSEMLRNREEEAHRLVEAINHVDGRNEGVYREALGETLLLEGKYTEALEALQPDEQGFEREFLRSTLFIRTRIHAERCDFPRVIEESDRYLRAGSSNAVELSQVYSYRAVALGALERPEEERTAALRQAEFASFRIANELDRLDALRSVAEAHLVLGNYEQAERYAREGLTLGLRHSGYYPTFSLLVMAGELSMRQKRTEEARFFVEEASFYVTLRPRLRARDVAAYWFLRWCLGLDGEEAVEAAQDLIALESQAIGDPELVEAFLRTRSFSLIGRADGEARHCP
ncbi:MAG: adenylate/guanylate cyclase domain-containing protein [Spirochaetaceae bacterium]